MEIRGGAHISQNPRGRFRVRLRWTDPGGGWSEGRWYLRSSTAAADFAGVLEMAVGVTADDADLFARVAAPAVLIRHRGGRMGTLRGRSGRGV